MGKQGEPIGHWLTRTRTYSRRPLTPLDGAYCNALLLAHWSVRQKLKHAIFFLEHSTLQVSPVSAIDAVCKPCQFSSVQLRRYVRAFSTH